ncbi:MULTISPECIES: GNAT family N-acetyltransferase [unclassified Halomonas]|uniref:GNAT family N-acetyltransferase n=1 Tax=unclassified Halomonas TaxID=2609666 RepID=UPI0040348551
MSLTIRQATLEDTNGLVDIGRKTYLETFSDFYPPEVMSKYLSQAFSVDQMANELQREQSQFWLLEVEGLCAGYLKINWGSAQTEMQEGAGLEIERIYLAHEFKGAGFGKLLFEKAQEIAKALARVIPPKNNLVTN